MDYKKIAIEHYRYFKMFKNISYLKQAKDALNMYKFVHI